MHEAGLLDEATADNAAGDGEQHAGVVVQADEATGRSGLRTETHSPSSPWRVWPLRYRYPSAPPRGDVLTRRIRLLVAVTITYNVIEAVLAITLASSTALIGFGLDSVIEVSSAAAVAWQFSARGHAVREAREQRTLRIIAVSFFALAVYVAVDATRALSGTGEAERSIPGIVIAALSLVIMPFLSAAQRRARRELGSAGAVADSKQTLLCTYLSAVLLPGLVLNAALGWSWADPIAALVIAVITVREGREAWQGKGCCAPAAALVPSADDEADACGCRPGCDCCN